MSGFADRHLSALFALACLMMRDRSQAESVVAEVVTDARHPSAEFVPATMMRRHLARLAYARCRWRLASNRYPERFWSRRGDDDGLMVADSPGLAAMTRLEAAGEQRRAVLALVLFGNHTVADVARFLHVPPATVAGLLASLSRDQREAEDLTGSANARVDGLTSWLRRPAPVEAQ